MSSWLRRAAPWIGRTLIAPYTEGSELSSLSGDRTRPIRFGSDELAGYSSELISTLDTFRRRLRFYRSLILLTRTAVLVLVVAFAFFLLDLTGALQLPGWLPILLGTIVLGGVALALLQHVSYLEVARVVDRQLGLKAQLGTAVELTLDGEPNRLARSQVRQATTIVRRLSARQAVSPRGPWRDLRLAGLAIAGILALSFLNSVGVRAAQPDPASQAALEALDPELNRWYELDPQTAAEMTQGAQPSSGLQAAVDRLREQLDKNEISPLEYQQAVADVQQQVQDRAEESARQQVALADLARSLADASSTQGVADSLNRGDYADAVRELSDLAGQTGRLSDEARQDLANKLAEAAKNTSPSNSALAAVAERASEALRSGDSAAAEEALRELASEVAQASERIAPQSELGDELQQAEAAQGESGMNGEGQNGDAQPGALASGDASDPAASESGRSGSGQDAQSGNPDSQSTIGSGAGAGTGPGEKITSGDPSNQALKADTLGNVLKISGRASGSGSQIQSYNPAVPAVVSSSTSSAVVQGSGIPSTERVNVIGESNSVPLDLRAIVRDYFSGGGWP